MKNLFYILLLSILFTSCYKDDIPLFGFTKWEHDGDILDNDIDAMKMIFNFPSNDSVKIYEDDVLLGKFYYDFNSFTGNGYVKEYDLSFMLKKDNDDVMLLFFNKEEYLFNKIN